MFGIALLSLFVISKKDVLGQTDYSGYGIRGKTHELSLGSKVISEGLSTMGISYRYTKNKPDKYNQYRGTFSGFEVEIGGDDHLYKINSENRFTPGLYAISYIKGRSITQPYNPGTKASQWKFYGRLGAQKTNFEGFNTTLATGGVGVQKTFLNARKRLDKLSAFVEAGLGAFLNNSQRAFHVPEELRIRQNGSISDKIFTESFLLPNGDMTGYIRFGVTLKVNKP